MDVSAVEELFVDFTIISLNVDQNNLMTMANVRTRLIVDVYHN